ncbi:hypothetical protein N9N67_10425 [Bacteriovoracaceae bacterium]|nr:hypothetical protein [Bacteriovoracaceae bacterium]
MKVQITCPECSSSIECYAKAGAANVQCGVCEHVLENLSFSENQEKGNLEACSVCHNNDLYQQKDFNRKIGVILFVIAAIASIYTYGISLIVLFLMDVFLFKRLGNIAVCYHCNTIYRGVNNLDQISDFDHERNDRIVYSD